MLQKESISQAFTRTGAQKIVESRPRSVAKIASPGELPAGGKFLETEPEQNRLYELMTETELSTRIEVIKRLQEYRFGKLEKQLDRAKRQVFAVIAGAFVAGVTVTLALLHFACGVHLRF
jgi:hypothetical protein